MKSWLPPKLRVLFFIPAANAVAFVIAALVLDRAGWFWFAPIALSINILLATYDLVLDFPRLRGERLSGQDAWGVLKLVHDASDRLHVRVPEVWLIDRPSAQLLSFARPGRRARLILTTGTLHVLTPPELAAVVTQQIVALRQGLGVVNYWTGAVNDLVHRAGRVTERAIGFVFGWTPKLANWLVRPLTWALNLFLLGRQDFVRLDQETAEQIPDPGALARALWKLDAYAQTRPWPEPWTFASMCAVSPIAAGPVGHALRVQPAVGDRITQLIGRFPI